MSVETERSSTPVDPRPRALVTGATGGMGVAIVTDLLRTHDVIATGRSAAALAQWDGVAGVTTRVANLLDPRALAALLPAGEPLDVLVHVAAIANQRSVESADVDEWTTQLFTNVIAPAELTRIALPALRASEGTVIFIGSGAGTRPVPGSVVYSASKHALRAVADTLRIEEEPNRLRVVTIAPGQTDTPLLRRGVEAGGGTYEPSRYIKPETVADAVRFVVDAPADTQITDIAVRPRVEIQRL